MENKIKQIGKLAAIIIMLSSTEYVNAMDEREFPLLTISARDYVAIKGKKLSDYNIMSTGVLIDNICSRGIYESKRAPFGNSLNYLPVNTEAIVDLRQMARNGCMGTVLIPKIK